MDPLSDLLRIVRLDGASFYAVEAVYRTGDVFCLVEAPSKEAAVRVHQEAHGLVADEVIEVREGE